VNVYLQLRVKQSYFGWGQCFTALDGKVFTLLGFTIVSDVVGKSRQVAVHCYIYDKVRLDL
jgi:hypothetical protein